MKDGYPESEDLLGLHRLTGDSFQTDGCKLIDLFKSTGSGGGKFYEGGDVRGRPTIVLELHTGGWSGCESMIEALRGSFFWARYWYSETRGGRFVFK